MSWRFGRCGTGAADSEGPEVCELVAGRGVLVGFGEFRAKQPPKTVASRWYTAAQVARGALLFATYCAPCHGKEAHGNFRWRQRDADGRYPPPPLNGSGSAWHHPKLTITRQIRDGSPPGGSMPGLGARLSAAQIEAVIAWFRHYWTAEIYPSWQRGMHHTG